MMAALEVAYIRQKPGRYGAGLRTVTRTSEPGRKLDLMLVGALIEARSCERFRLLAPRLPAPISEFYATLAVSEARHFELYLNLAKQADPERDMQNSARNASPLIDRLRTLAECEAELATSPDAAFRFHSGAPQSP